MRRMLGHGASPVGTADDAELVRRALARDGQAFRAIMQAHNRRLYRIARSIVRDDEEAEDVLQDSYMRAFANLGSFRGESRLGTWLARIVMNEALGRLRSRQPTVDRSAAGERRHEAEIIQFPYAANFDNPERTMAQREILRLVEAATDDLPADFRTVFVARVIEGMSVEETAVLLGLRAETVKTRLHRARRLVLRHVNRRAGPLLLDAFPFAGQRCERLTQAVLCQLGNTIEISGNLSENSPSNVRRQQRRRLGAFLRKHLMLTRLSMTAALVLLLGGTALGQGKPTDPQIAHIAYTAGAIDVAAAKQALAKSRNQEVRAFAQDMLRDHEAVNKQALALVKKLHVTPQDNDTSRALSMEAAHERAILGRLSGAAFDKAYAGNEVAYHKKVNGALETLLIPSASNPELKSLLQTGLKIFQGHEQHAEIVAQALK